MLHTTPRRIALFAAPILALALVAVPARAQLALGADMPSTAVKMKNVNDKELTLASQAGKKGTLVVFTCNACPWAKKWQDRVAEIGNAAAAAGLGVVAINSNDPSLNAEDGFAEMKKRSKALKMKFPYVVDATSDVARSFGATRTPEAFVFDASGKLVYHGTIDDNANEPASVKEFYLKDAVNAVAEGKAIETAETKAFGCTIKFRGEKKPS